MSFPAFGSISNVPLTWFDATLQFSLNNHLPYCTFLWGARVSTGQQRQPAHAFRGRPQQPQHYQQQQQQQHQQTAISNSRELSSNDDRLLQQRHGGIGLSRGHNEEMLTHAGGVSGVEGRGVGKASMRGGGASIGRGVPGGRVHSHQMQVRHRARGLIRMEIGWGTDVGCPRLCRISAGHRHRTSLELDSRLNCWRTCRGEYRSK